MNSLVWFSETHTDSDTFMLTHVQSHTFTQRAPSDTEISLETYSSIPVPPFLPLPSPPLLASRPLCSPSSLSSVFSFPNLLILPISPHDLSVAQIISLVLSPFPRSPSVFSFFMPVSLLFPFELLQILFSHWKISLLGFYTQPKLPQSFRMTSRAPLICKSHPKNSNATSSANGYIRYLHMCMTVHDRITQNTSISDAKRKMDRLATV